MRETIDNSKMSDTEDLEKFFSENQNHFNSVSTFYSDQHNARQVDIEFWKKASLEKGGPILELGCGTGRILIPIASAGVDITGIDASQRMLDTLLGNLNKLDQEVVRRINLIHGRFPEAIPKESFQQVFMTFGILQFVLTDHDSLFKKIKEVLKPNGRLVVDVRSYSFIHGKTSVSKPAKFFKSGEHEIQLNKIVSYDHVTQVIKEQYNWKLRNTNNGSERKLKTTQLMRVYYRFELEYLLRLNGFKIIETYGDYSGGAISNERPEGTSKRLIYIAQPVS
jgi:ubiquinone/menaquinone biosynthesis C-methylase UbiE